MIKSKVKKFLPKKGIKAAKSAAQMAGTDMEVKPTQEKKIKFMAKKTTKFGIGNLKRKSSGNEKG